MTLDRWALKFAVPIPSEPLLFKGFSFLNQQYDSRSDFTILFVSWNRFKKASYNANSNEKEKKKGKSEMEEFQIVTLTIFAEKTEFA